MIIAAFNEKDTYVTIYGLYQYDYGQVLRIQGLNLPKAVEIHFALQDKGGESITRVGTTKDGATDVLIPDSMLENNGTSSDYKIYAFVYIADEISGKTERRIEMSVKSRPKPEAFDRLEDAELFMEAIKAVNESAARSAESERQAEGWAHGRENLPEREQDNAKYYSEQAKEDSAKTDADRKEVERLVESVSGVDEQVETIRGYSEQAQTSATNAALSESAAKESENHAAQARAGAEIAEDNAELAAQKTAEDKSVVEQAKDFVMQIGQEVLENKNLVDRTTQEFTLKAQQAVADVNNAGQSQTERVQTAGNAAVESVESAQRTATGAVETAKTEAIKTVQEEGAARTGTVAAEGEKQVQAVQDAAAEIVADRQKIIQNKKDVTQLRQDLNGLLQIKNTPNLLNPSMLEWGKNIGSTGNVEPTNPNIGLSEIIKVNASLPLKSTSNLNAYLYQFASDGSLISSKTDFNSSAQVALNSACDHVRVGVWKSVLPMMIYQSDKKLKYVEYGIYSDNVRKRMDIYVTDTEEEIYLKMREAYDKGNYDVYWEHGTYNFSTIYDTLKNKYEFVTAYELPIGGNCRYYFNGATVIGTGISTDSNVIGNSSIFGALRSSQSYELYDGIFIANHLIYCVHEEAQSSNIPYRIKYHNLKMIHNTVTDDYDKTYGLRKCIGGGTGLYPNIEVSNCYFQTDHGYDIGWHGHSKEDETLFNLNIHDCYFSHGISTDEMSANETCELVFHGNSSPKIPSTSHNGNRGWKVTAWNNENRIN